MNNEDRELIQSFCQECRELLLEYEEALVSLDEQNLPSEFIKHSMRIFHTIKGTASCVGLTNFSKGIHEIEDFITQFTKKDLEYGPKEYLIFLNIQKLIEEKFNIININFLDSADFDLIINQYFGSIKLKEKLKSSPNESDMVKNINSFSYKAETINVSKNLIDEISKNTGELTVLRTSIYKYIKKLNSKYKQDMDYNHLLELMDGFQDLSSLTQKKIAQMGLVETRSILSL